MDEVSIANSGKGRNDVRLRWRHNKKRYSLCIGKRTTANIAQARIKAAQIEMDLVTGEFDQSLNKYRGDEDYAGRKATASTGDIVVRYQYWAVVIRQVEFESSHYLSIKRLLQRWGTFNLSQVPELLHNENYSVSTYNARLTNLKLFLDWRVAQGEIKSNPLKDVKRKKRKARSLDPLYPKRSPLSIVQIKSILDAIRTDSLLSKYSGYKHSHYYPFVKFLFACGVRPAEAIGLRGKHVDFERKTIHIAEALARTNKGTHAKARIVKLPKNEKGRYLPINEEMRAMLQPLVRGDEDLIFLSPRGMSIDDRMFQRRVLKPILIKLGIEDHDLYCTRHSFGSHAIDQGLSLADTASLMGHATIRTTSDNYVKTVNVPNRMPTLFSDEFVDLHPADGSHNGSQS